MSKTVIGIFEHERDAQNAQNFLLAYGFDDKSVDIKTASYKTEDEDSSRHEHEADWMERIGRFFRALFEDDEESTMRYTETGKHGTIVTVHVASSEEAQLAASVMDNFGAVDMRKDRTEPAIEPYEDPILNPPSVMEQRESSRMSEESNTGDERHTSENKPLRSTTFNRSLDQNTRLRQQQGAEDQVNIEGMKTGTSVEPLPHGTIPPVKSPEDSESAKEIGSDESVPLNRTVAERDELLKEIIRKSPTEGEE